MIVDDLHLAIAVMTDCHFYPRSGYLEAPMTVIAAYAASSRKRLVVATDGNVPEAIGNRAYHASIADFTAADYRHLCELFLGAERTSQLDFEKIHRFAPRLNAHQLRNACYWHRERDRLETDELIDYLREQELASNVALGEVATVALDDLKGIDDIIQQLEANIALPMENDELAAEPGLKPKRGVLLVGPPGTGKTTVGRALAHRLKGKFFLVDGTFISGTEKPRKRSRREILSSWCGQLAGPCRPSAAVQIDRCLQFNAAQQGESRPDGRRVLYAPPLGITFRERIF